MTDKIKLRIILVLSLLALALGFLVFDKSKIYVPQKSPESKLQSNKSLSLISSGEFSEDEIKLLRPPQQGASKAEVDEHSKLAAKLSVIGKEVDISNCKAKPLVLQAHEAFMIRVINSGKTDIMINFDGKKNLEIPAGKSIELNSVFVHGAGLYGYVCEKLGFKGLVGFVLVTPK